MAIDLTPIFAEWAHDSSDDSKNVRCVRGADGRLKIQVRVRCGMFQWEFDGRPDGASPHGCTSLLDYYRDRIKTHGRRRRSALRLTPEEIGAISEETMDYYQRRILFFRLGEYERARDDAQHNLDLMDLIRDFCDEPEAVAQHEKWRAFVTMDRARAEALLLCQNGAYVESMRKIDQGVEEIIRIFHQQGREDFIAASQEIAALKELRLQLRESYDIPLTQKEVLESLREEQAKAIADEDYERAARLRDEITRYEKGEGPKVV